MLCRKNSNWGWYYGHYRENWLFVMEREDEMVG